MPRLFLIPTTLSTSISSCGVLHANLVLINHLRHFIVETAKTGRSHLKHLCLKTPLQQLHINELNKHKHNLSQLLLPLLAGHDVGLISDCGMPAVADPGSELIRLAHQNNINVVPLAGPTSLIMALMASGINSQSFAFAGYLPIVASKRKHKIEELEKIITTSGQSQIIIEAPFRNRQLLLTLVDTLSPNIYLSISVDLMTNNETIVSNPIDKWRNLTNLPDINKKEVVFVLGL